jgi:integrase
MTSQQGYTLKQQLEIKSWIENSIPPIQCLKMLGLFYRMVEWGKREERLVPGFVNKFKDYERAYKLSLKTLNTKRKSPKGVEHLIPTEGIKAWSDQERDIIIAAFHSRLSERELTKRKGKPDHKAYLVEFLFLVGCRHGEAFALTWGDVDSDFKRIRINKSYSSTCRILKGTKTGKVRTVPVNSRVQEILHTLKPNNVVADDLIFPNTEGNNINSSTLHSLWSPTGVSTVIGRLIKEGKLTRYLDAYSTRRTFVSLQISKGATVVDVAKWVGDNPETILKHYAGHNEEAVPY